VDICVCLNSLCLGSHSSTSFVTLIFRSLSCSLFTSRPFCSSFNVSNITRIASICFPSSSLGIDQDGWELDNLARDRHLLLVASGFKVHDDEKIDVAARSLGSFVGQPQLVATCFSSPPTCTGIDSFAVCALAATTTTTPTLRLWGRLVLVPLVSLFAWHRFGQLAP
jgi:hypothetical protein